MVNYTMGEGTSKMRDFVVKSTTGEVCIAMPLDFETRSVYEFPVIATDRGGLSTTAVVKIQLTDVNDNRPTFYPREYNVSLREDRGTSNAPVVVVAATDPDSGHYGTVHYELVAAEPDNDGLFRVDRKSGAIFVTRPLSRAAPRHHLNVSASDGAGLRAAVDAEVFLSVVASGQQPPVFEKPRYSLNIREDASRSTVVGSVRATSSDPGSGVVRYSIYSGDPNGYFNIDPLSGTIRTSSSLDHETHSSVLLNVQAMSGDPPTYGHSQVYIAIQDVNDNAPEFDSPSVRISVPENVDLGTAIYAAHARDPDSGENGDVRYSLPVNPGGVFRVDAKGGQLTLAKALDFEVSQRFNLVVQASDRGAERQMSANLSVLVEVQDANDNPPTFERLEYTVHVPESLPANSQVVQVAASDKDTGNNARLTYRLLGGADAHFGIFPNSGAVYLREPLDRETQDRYTLKVLAKDNGSPAGTATASIVVVVLDSNDNAPEFGSEAYHFVVRENLEAGTSVGTISATDKDLENNAALRYSIIPANNSFQINPVTGEIFTREPLDREAKALFELIAEARDLGSPPRSSRVPVKVQVADVNDNAPLIVEPEEDVVGVREQQPVGTEVVRVRAIDRDEGENSSIAYSIVQSPEASDGYAVFTVDPVTGVVRTKAILTHEEKGAYRLAVAASDRGRPAKQSLRLLRVEVLDVNDSRPTFSSASLVFRVPEGVPTGFEVGTVTAGEGENSVEGGKVTYTLSADELDEEVAATFTVSRTTGVMLTTRDLDRERASSYQLEVRAIDSSGVPQVTSLISITIEVEDVNDEAPFFAEDPVLATVAEDAVVGSSVWNFTAEDNDLGVNGEVWYSLSHQWPRDDFTIDPETGVLSVSNTLDRELHAEYMLVVTATDQAVNASQRLRSSATAKILVLDANDNAPRFVSRSILWLSGDEPSGIGAAPLMQVIATDADAQDNGRVSYFLHGDDHLEGLFTIDHESGLLGLARPLGRRHGGARLVLNVTARDSGKPAKASSQLLEIEVAGGSDSPARFLQSVYETTVSEDVPSGTFVVKVSARDPDSGGSPDNLTYFIPEGMADGRFSIDSRRGVVTTSGPLDRELNYRYVLPIYVRDDSARPLQLDSATLVVSVADANDNSPQFAPGSCYPLSVPENSDLAVIHTVVATDLDEGRNGEVTYSITSGNVGNKFSIESHTGELSARPLDREAQAAYWLVITAEDRGTPALTGACNLSITVGDQNDNNPKFALPRYAASLPENAPLDSTVLTVQATDADIGTNARITYSLTNESQWLFKIDNATGVITTAGPLDREKQRVYSFQVVATDGGRYDARSEKVSVQLTVNDVNDNKPVFERYPFTAEVAASTQPGQALLQVSAQDKDEGANADIVYSFVNEPHGSKFRINPSTGVVTASSSLSSDSGRLYHLEVLARDKGNPPQSATGLVEIRVGETRDAAAAAAALRFQNLTYVVSLPENAPTGKDVVQVSAVRADGRRQRITYSFGSGNEDNTFEINSNNGLVRVRDPRLLDYESAPRLRLVVVAQADGAQPPLYGYATVWVEVQDVNDNAPRFTQERYYASVWEGNNKGTFVMQVSATDADEGANSHILYHIVDGNHDNAFVIEPPFSGLVKTNIVLDREIRDSYRLTVIATDEGRPQLTGTATLSVTIVDVNDNQPTFPPHSVISVNEGATLGSVVAEVTANDVDTNPALTYSFAEGGNPDSTFSIDRFSGAVTLARQLDFEGRKSYELKVRASDAAHAVFTSLTVHVTDENDNTPMFEQQSYEVALSELTEPGQPILTVNASDADSGENARIHFSLLGASDGFKIDEHTGVIYTNRSVEYDPRRPHVQLLVAATDGGIPSRSAVAAVRVHLTDVTDALPRFPQEEFRVHIREDATLGSVVKRLPPAGGLTDDLERSSLEFTIISGNDEDLFRVLSPSGELILVGPLDRESRDLYSVNIGVRSRMAPSANSTVSILVQVDDTNDNAPEFSQPRYETHVSESAAVGRSVLRLTATDRDTGRNAKLLFEITSGNEEGLFTLDPSSGVISIAAVLDRERAPMHRLVVRASDQSQDKQLAALASVLVKVDDENDNAPRFPVSRYTSSVPENSPVGTRVARILATDMDRGEFGLLNYSIVAGDGRGRFAVDDTGMITTLAVFDYESVNRYSLTLKANDQGGLSATALVAVDIESRDEFHPEFTESTYRFVAPLSPPVGYVVGSVHASDRDLGPDGRVIYALASQDSHFKVNRTTGAVLVRKPISNEAAGSEVRLVVSASSGRPGSLTNMTIVEVALNALATGGSNLVGAGAGSSAEAASSGGLADWALSMLIALILLLLAFGGAVVFLHMRKQRQCKPSISTEPFDHSSFDTIDVRGPTTSAVSPMAQFPPKYDEIPAYEAAAVVAAERRHHRHHGSHHANSELSEQSQSASSGRGSAEDDGVDEEICMINEGPLIQQSGPQSSSSGHVNRGLQLPGDSGCIQGDEDNLSDVSVHNTQQYLARLGIDTSRSQVDTASSKGGTSIVAGGSQELLPPLGHSIFDDENGEADLANLLYAKLQHGPGSSGASATGDDQSAASTGGGGDVRSTLLGFTVADEGPSMTGSLSSIVHSEEELTGSYNWDYLLDWGPQYQPLAHVFSEIARLKDDTAPSSTYGGIPGKKAPLPLTPQVKTVPPPLITNVAPRSIAPVARASHQMPRSPISHEFAAAMSPSFSPSLSPLATRSPSISPLVGPSLGPHHGRALPPRPTGLVSGTPSGSEAELRI
ncbi:Hypothetical predicted protein [Cloeon dipterum]|nr:Hypothetical predicted protein [Cloeon dipterum]